MNASTPNRAAVDAPLDRPARIAVAAALVALQGLALAGYGLISLVLLFTTEPDGLTQAVTMIVTVLLLSVLPLAAARGLWLLRRWSRGPALVMQLLALPVAWQLLHSAGTAAVPGGAGLGAAAVTVLALLVNPTATEALGIGPERAG